MTANRILHAAVAILVLVLTRCSVSQADLIVMAYAEAGNQALPPFPSPLSPRGTSVLGVTVNDHDEGSASGEPDDRYETPFEAGYQSNASATAEGILIDESGNVVHRTPSFYLRAEANSWEGSGGVSPPGGGAAALAEVWIKDSITISVLASFVAPLNVVYDVKVEGGIYDTGTIRLSVNGVDKRLDPDISGSGVMFFDESFNNVGEVTIDGLNLTRILEMYAAITASYIGLAEFSNTITIGNFAVYDAEGNRLPATFTSALGFDYTQAPLSAVPEPGTLTLAGLGGVGLVGGGWRRRRRVRSAMTQRWWRGACSPK